VLISHSWGQQSQTDAALVEATAFLQSVGLSGLVAKEIIDLSKVSLPSVVTLRDIWRVPLPRDPQVFLLELAEPDKKQEYLKSLDSLFSPIREGSREMGKTFYGRFILVDPDISPGKFYSKAQFERILAHELVHAYVKSLLGLENDRLPKWFHEGLASHLSDSGAGAVTHEYRTYAGVFEYVEERFGDDILAEFVRRGVRLGYVDQNLLEIVDLTSEGGLIRASVNWQDAKRVQIVAPLFLGLGFLLLRTTALFRFPRRMLLSGWRLFRLVGVRNRQARKELYRLDEMSLLVSKDKLVLLADGFKSAIATSSANLFKLNRVVHIVHQMKEDQGILNALDEREQEGTLHSRGRMHRERLQRRLALYRAKHADIAHLFSDTSNPTLHQIRSALAWVKQQSRPLRKWFWSASPNQLRWLQGILGQWVDSASQDVVWRRSVANSAWAILAVSTAGCWFLRSLSLPWIYIVVRWINGA